MFSCWVPALPGSGGRGLQRCPAWVRAAQRLLFGVGGCPTALDGAQQRSLARTHRDRASTHTGEVSLVPSLEVGCRQSVLTEATQGVGAGGR